MSIKYNHSDTYSMYYSTFICYNWLPIIDTTNSHNIVYKWFNILETKNIHVVAYVIMLNHIHCILHFPTAGFSLNKIIGNAKRFMAYEIIKSLEEDNQHKLLQTLSQEVTANEKKRGQLHRVLKTLLMPKLYFLRSLYCRK